MADALLSFEPQQLSQINANTPSFDVVTTTNIIQFVANFDDTTQEYLNGKFTVPDTIDSSGTATFRAAGYAATTAASKNVAFDFDHIAVANAEDLDGFSYTTEASGDKAVTNTQNALDQYEWTETVANLGWAAADTVFFRFSRKAASSNNLSGDWRAVEFDIYIPVT